MTDTGMEVENIGNWNIEKVEYEQTIFYLEEKEFRLSSEI